MVKRNHMPTFRVETGHYTYDSVVERGILDRIRDYVPAKAGKVFLVTTEDVWKLHGATVNDQLPGVNVLFFSGGESNKRLAALEVLAEHMVERGADRTSIVIGFGGGIVTDLAGFLAAVFMRGIPVLQIPTTLLAQVDAAVGGKTGVNLMNGKNLIGSFHQPLAVLIDPAVLSTLPEREYRAGLFEVVKTGVIRDAKLFDLMLDDAASVLAMEPGVVDDLISASVRVKAEVVTADEKESDLRRILNFGHTVGHAIEAETEYKSFLHGEAIAWGMLAATLLAKLLNLLQPEDARRIQSAVCRYGPLPPARHLDPDRLLARLASDKKTLQGKVHFVLPTCIGHLKVVSGVDPSLVRQAIVESLQ
jgi:3-dehydroquinate synthase